MVNRIINVVAWFGILVVFVWLYGEGEALSFEGKLIGVLGFLVAFLVGDVQDTLRKRE